MVKIRSINGPNINRLRNAFLDCLLENDVRFESIGLQESGENLMLFLKVKEQVRVIEFEKQFCIGHEPMEVAEDIVKTLLSKLKGKKD